MLKKVQKIFISGLMSFLPFAAAIYIIVSVVGLFENFLGNTLKMFLPMYFPGMGFIATILIIFFFGLLLNSLITESIFRNLEAMFLEIPFFRTVYSPLRDLMNLFSKTSKSKMQSVVLVHLQPQGLQALGIITRDPAEEVINLPLSNDPKVAVYIPLSYSMGGFTLLVEKSKLTPVNISVEKAMSLILTGWVASDTKAKGDSGNE